MIEGFIESKILEVKAAIKQYQATHPHNRLTNAHFYEEGRNRLIHADLGAVDFSVTPPRDDPPKQKS